MDDIDATLNVNLRAPIVACQATIKDLDSGSRISNGGDALAP
jgi:hypothetical protein